MFGATRTLKTYAVRNTAIVNNTTDTTGVLDLNTVDANDLLFVLVVGSSAASAGVSAIHLEESHDNSTYVDITGATFGAGVITASTDANKILLQTLQKAGRRRYVRLSFTVANGAPGTQITCVAIGGNPQVAPQPAVATTYGATVLSVGTTA